MRATFALILCLCVLVSMGTVTVVDLTRQVTGVLPEAGGGTGTTTYQRTVISGHCTGTASTGVALGLFDLGGTATTCTVTTTTNLGFVVTAAATIKNLQVIEGTSQKSGTTMAWTAQKCTAGSCSGQTLTCTVGSGGTSCSDVSHSFTVAAGDVVQIKSGNTAASSETLANVSASMELWN